MVVAADVSALDFQPRGRGTTQLTEAVLADGMDTIERVVALLESAGEHAPPLRSLRRRAVPRQSVASIESSWPSSRRAEGENLKCPGTYKTTRHDRSLPRFSISRYIHCHCGAPRNVSCTPSKRVADGCDRRPLCWPSASCAHRPQAWPLRVETRRESQASRVGVRAGLPSHRRIPACLQCARGHMARTIAMGRHSHPGRAVRRRLVTRSGTWSRWSNLHCTCPSRPQVPGGLRMR